MLTTFFFTVVFDLIIAIEIGVVLSSLLFMKRMSDSLHVQVIENDTLDSEYTDTLIDENYPNIPKDVLVYEINGPLFFGASRYFQDTLSHINYHPVTVIIRMRYVPFIDATGFRSLSETIKAFQSSGTRVILSGVKEEVRAELESYHIEKILDASLIFENFPEAIQYVTASNA